jgi:hypothetical protein
MGWKGTFLMNVSVDAVEKIPPRDSIQDSGVAGERTMNSEIDDGLVRVLFAWTVLACFSRIVHGADANGVCAGAMPETAAFGRFLQRRESRARKSSAFGEPVLAADKRTAAP